MAGGDDGVVGTVRHGRVPAAARNPDVEFGGGGKDRPLPDRKPADGQARQIVHAEHLFDAETIHEAVPDHLAAAAAGFLGRLEDDDDGAGEVAGLGQIGGSTQQHGGVAVMAAGVHPPFMGRGVRLAGDLGDRQGVHVGTQADDAAIAQLAAYDADKAGAADPGHHLVAAEGAQLAGDEIRGG